LNRAIPLPALALLLPLFSGMLSLCAFAQGTTPVRAIRAWSQPGVTRVVVEMAREVSFNGDRLHNPERFFYDLSDTRLALEMAGKGPFTIPVNDRLLQQIRVSQFNAGTVRLVFDLNSPVVTYSASFLTNPARFVVEIQGGVAAAPTPSVSTNSSASLPAVVSSTAKNSSRPVLARAVLPTPKPVTRARFVFDTAPDFITYNLRYAPLVSSFPMQRLLSFRVRPLPAKKPVVEVATRTTVPSVAPPKATPPPPPAPRPAPATTDEDREAEAGRASLTRALGLKVGRVMIDPGHGGHDTGTISPGGLYEKDLVLDIARRVGKLLESKLGSEVLYTRNDDVFIPLEKRTRLANEAHADLFLSIHCNSSKVRSASGIETYYLNFTSSPEAMEVAARENATAEQTVGDLQDLVKKIALKEKIGESREFAARVQQSQLSAASRNGSRARDRGVRKAPFIVLIGAQMPSILTEVGFLSNRNEENQLKKPEQRQRIAEGIYRGIAAYISALNPYSVARQGTVSSAP
jgi:N-acetylmuramoyl-L-alanine amidase